LAIEPTLNLLQDRASEKAQGGGAGAATTFKANERTFALITNTLAKDKEISDRWRGFRTWRIRGIWPIASNARSSMRWWFGSRGLSAAVASLLPVEGGLVQKKKLAHWDRNAPLPFAATGSNRLADAKNMVLTAYRGFSPEMADIAARFFTDRWIDAPVRPGKAPGAFSHPTTHRRILTCS